VGLGPAGRQTVVRRPERSHDHRHRSLCRRFMVWLLILSRNELSVAYPIAIGLALVGTTAAGLWILSEPVTMWRLAGSAFVFLGIAMLVKS
jgi:multidrug transporter EmrE-like cation transporter